MNQRLVAFWRYDLYPYILGGEATEMDDRGYVHVPSYQGRFKPIKILPYEPGMKLLEKLKELEAEYKNAQADLRGEWENKLERVMPEALIK